MGTSFEILFFLRRKTPQSCSNLVRLCFGADHGLYRLTVVDKTGDPTWVRAQAAIGAGTRHVVRERDEPYFRTVVEVLPASDARVMQVHDDDDFFGYPIPHEHSSDPVLPARIEPEWWGRAPLQPSHQALLFGAIHPDVWARFRNFCSQQHRPQFALDQTLVFWLDILGPGPYLQGYTYIYRNTHWTTVAQTVEHDTNIAREAGWGIASTPEATRWMTHIDTVTSLPFLVGLIEPREVSRLAADAIRNGPGLFGNSPLATIAARTPQGIRERIVISREAKSQLSRAVQLLRPHRASRFDLVPASLRSILNGSVSPTTVDELIIQVIAPLENCGITAIAERASVWRDLLGRLQALPSS